METLAKQFLFWDADLSQLNSQKHEKYIIRRILSFGDLEDYYWAVKQYGKDKLKEVLLSSRGLDKKSINFWCLIFNIDKNQCTKKQSVQGQSMFSKRLGKKNS